MALLALNLDTRCSRETLEKIGRFSVVRRLVAVEL
jgi:hypothetical protein